MPSAPPTIRERREALGLTREQLAHEATCSYAMLRVLEGGYRPERSPALDRVLSVLRVHEAASKPAYATADDSHRQDDLAA